jgi:hypothetical protein
MRVWTGSTWLRIGTGGESYIVLLILEFFRIKIFYSRSFPQTGENPLHSPWASWAQFRKRKPTSHSVHSEVCSDKLQQRQVLWAG